MKTTSDNNGCMTHCTPNIPTSMVNRPIIMEMIDNTDLKADY